MSKHTPGPWEAISNVVRGPMKDGGYLIAECPANIGNRLEDARLIAAAPELLEAIELLTSMCEVHGDFSNGVTDPTGSIDEGDVIAGEIIKKARAAIAKAIGG